MTDPEPMPPTLHSSAAARSSRALRLAIGTGLALAAAVGLARRAAGPRAEGAAPMELAPVTAARGTDPGASSLLPAPARAPSDPARAAAENAPARRAGEFLFRSDACGCGRVEARGAATPGTPTAYLVPRSTDARGADEATVGVLQDRLRRALPGAAACFRRAERALPGEARGSAVVVRFSIDARGHVSRAAGSGLPASLARCVAAQVRAVTFPAPRYRAIDATTTVAASSG